MTGSIFAGALLSALVCCGGALAAGRDQGQHLEQGAGQGVGAPAAAADSAVAATPAPASTPTAIPTPAPAACCVIPAGTLVTVELTEPLSASKAKGGDHFGLRLAEPIVIGDATVLPAGAIGVGEVIDAKPAGIGGRPARLVLAARYLESGGVRVTLQSLKLGGGGKDHSELAVGAVIAVGIVGALVPGGGVDYPAGTRASAKVAADVTSPPPTPASPRDSVASPADGAPAAPAAPPSNPQS